LDGFTAIRHLATDIRSYPTEVTERFFYEFEVGLSAPDFWSHTVSDGELDKGMIFAYRWPTVAEAQGVLGHMGDYLHLLK
jgi:hypothetical protein